jgi:hypothetical protein
MYAAAVTFRKKLEHAACKSSKSISSTNCSSHKHPVEATGISGVAVAHDHHINSKDQYFRNKS